MEKKNLVFLAAITFALHFQENLASDNFENIHSNLSEELAAPIFTNFNHRHNGTSEFTTIEKPNNILQVNKKEGSKSQSNKVFFSHGCASSRGP